jgi:hypothetical protein
VATPVRFRSHEIRLITSLKGSDLLQPLPLPSAQYRLLAISRLERLMTHQRFADVRCETSVRVPDRLSEVRRGRPKVGRSWIADGCKLLAAVRLQDAANHRCAPVVTIFARRLTNAALSRARLSVLRQGNYEFSYEWLHEERAARRCDAHLHPKRPLGSPVMIDLCALVLAHS